MEPFVRLIVCRELACLKEFLLGVDKLLKKEHLKFVVIRNYKKLPDLNVGNDIDLII